MPEQPLRLAAFDNLFATGVRSVHRIDQLRVRLELAPEPAVAAQAADLMTRESGCCSFFTFSLMATDGRLVLEVRVPDTQAGVLVALADRAATGARGSRS